MLIPCLFDWFEYLQRRMSECLAQSPQAAESTTRQPKHRCQHLLGHRGHGGVGALGCGRGGSKDCLEASGVVLETAMFKREPQYLN